MSGSSPQAPASNEPTSAAASGLPGADSGPRSIRLPVWRVLFTLIRREFWEHRVLWLAPLVVSVLTILAAFPSAPGLGLFNFDLLGSLADSGGVPESWHHLSAATLGSDMRRALFGLGHWILSWPQYLVMTLVLSFYLIDSLYAERKDRSILFWRSLPVSDLATVGSKVLVGLVLMPLGVFLLDLVTDLLFSGVWRLRVALGAPSASLMPWDTASWLKVQGLMLVGVIASILWYAPLGTYLLLVSAWARRNVFLWAALPPLLAPLIERLAFGTSHIGMLLLYRTFGLWGTPAMQAAIERSSVPLGGHGSNLHGELPSPAALFDTLPTVSLFTNIDVWLGVAAAIAFAVLAARVRRYRDDS